MKKAKTLSSVLRDMVEAMTFTIDYKLAADNGNGTYTISGICDIHHLQPGFSITIGADTFVASDYAESDLGFSVLLTAGTNNLPAYPSSFDLYTPFFFHGNPIRKENELKDINNKWEKTPMIYLMEPYDTEMDDNPLSSIDRRVSATICFLTQAIPERWRTADYHHNTIEPMYRLGQDFMRALKEHGGFLTKNMKPRFIFHHDFSIHMKDLKKEPLFTDALSGASADMRFELYTDFSCCADANLLSDDFDQFIQVD